MVLKMPIAIGAKPRSTFTDPIGLLTDCHRRIELFLAVLAHVSAQARGGPLSREEREAVEKALRYFREGATKHTADEEETLFPRLRSIERPDWRAVLEKTGALEDQHEEAKRGHAEIEHLGRKWLTAGSLTLADRTRFAELVADLGDLYRGHIAVEEQEVFPMAWAVLPRSELEAMGREMAARRGLQRE
jgi:hemerythrin-like domain-containing protein